MKVVVASDWHGDWSSLGVARFAEVKRAVYQAADHAVQIGAKLFVVPGDIADPDTGGGTFQTIALAVDVALRLAHAGVASVWVAGNHDVCEDGSGATTLTPLAAVAAHVRDVHVAERPCVVYPVRGLSVLCLPFVPASHGEDMGAAARRLLDGVPAGQAVLAVGHLSIPGITPGTETNEMPRGREVSFPLAETRGVSHRVSGHYHLRQLFDPGDGGPEIVIPGALARLGFGEQDHDPSFVVLDVATAP